MRPPVTLHAMHALLLITGEALSGTIARRAREHEDQVDEPPHADAAQREQLGDCRADLAEVEAIGAEDPQEQREEPRRDERFLAFADLARCGNGRRRRCVPGSGGRCGAGVAHDGPIGTGSERESCRYMRTRQWGMNIAGMFGLIHRRRVAFASDRPIGQGRVGRSVAFRYRAWESYVGGSAYASDMTDMPTERRSPWRAVSRRAWSTILFVCGALLEAIGAANIRACTRPRDQRPAASWPPTGLWR